MPHTCRASSGMSGIFGIGRFFNSSVLIMPWVDGDRVMVVQEGSSARKILKDERIPVQAVIVGIVETVTLEQ